MQIPRVDGYPFIKFKVPGCMLSTYSGSVTGCMTLSLVMYVVLYLVGSETMGLFADLARMINVESRIHRIIRPEAREHCAYKECAGHVIAFDLDSGVFQD